MSDLIEKAEQALQARMSADMGRSLSWSDAVRIVLKAIRTPTEQMTDAGAKAVEMIDFTDTDAATAWRAMIDEALAGRQAEPPRVPRFEGAR